MLDALTLKEATPMQQRLHEDHKARRARMNAAARRFEFKPAPAPVLVESEPAPAIGAPPPPKPRLTTFQKIKVIQRVVGEEFGVGVLEIVGASRFAHLMTARFVAIYLCLHITKLSLPHIGRRFGGRDHTTILNADNQIRRRIAADPEFAARVEGIKVKLLEQFAEGG